MGYQLGIPAALRRYGLTVEIVPGWETRGSATFAPRGVVCHWTAGPRTGDRPSLRVCINGRTDLPGPLCQVFLTRGGIAVVVAAGRANHAGAGGAAGLTGNSAVFGIEAEASGNEWTEAQRSAYPRVVAALADLCAPPRAVIGHSEWAPTRKIDINGYTMDLMRAQVSGLRLGGGPATLPESDMRLLQTLVGATVDGVWGPQTVRAVQAWLGVTPDGIFGPTSTRALQARIGVNPDGTWGPATTDALHSYLTTTDSTVPEEDIMATTDELRAIIREELRALLTEPTGMDWSRPAQGDSILSAVQGVLHMRDVPATLTPETEESQRLDVRVRAIEDKLDKLLAQRDGLRDAMGV